MKRMLLAALAAIALSFSLSAQDYTGGVKGTVVNRNGRQPIEKARLVLSKGAEQVAETETLEDGSFSIPGLPDGMYTLTIVAPDFLDNQVQVTVNDGYVKNMFNLGMTAVNRITEIDDDSFGAFDMEDSGYNEMKYLKALMLAMPYFTRIPDQSIVIGNGLRYDRLSATRGNDYLMVYSYRSDRMKIDLRKITGKKKNLWWMDAATGTLTFMGTVDNGVHDIRLPKNASEQPGDGVLIAIDATKEYISKQQTTILTTKPWVAPRNLNE